MYWSGFHTCTSLTSFTLYINYFLCTIWYSENGKTHVSTTNSEDECIYKWGSEFCLYKTLENPRLLWNWIARASEDSALLALSRWDVRREGTLPLSNHWPSLNRILWSDMKHVQSARCTVATDHDILGMSNLFFSCLLRTKETWKEMLETNSEHSFSNVNYLGS